MIGDVLKERLNEVRHSEDKRKGDSSFCEVIKRIAVEEINELYPERIDSDVIIEVYYKILSQHKDYIPTSLLEITPSNGQERFRNAVRNIFTSNAYHTNGLANNPNLKVVKVVNENRKGRRYSYKGVEGYVNKK